MYAKGGPKKLATTKSSISHIKASQKLDFFRQIKVSVNDYNSIDIKYSTRDIICDVQYCA